MLFSDNVDMKLSFPVWPKWLPLYFTAYGSITKTLSRNNYYFSCCWKF